MSQLRHILPASALLLLLVLTVSQTSSKRALTSYPSAFTPETVPLRIVLSPETSAAAVFASAVVGDSLAGLSSASTQAYMRMRENVSAGFMADTQTALFVYDWYASNMTPAREALTPTFEEVGFMRKAFAFAALHTQAGTRHLPQSAAAADSLFKEDVSFDDSFSLKLQSAKDRAQPMLDRLLLELQRAAAFVTMRAVEMLPTFAEQANTLFQIGRVEVEKWLAGKEIKDTSTLPTKRLAAIGSFDFSDIGELGDLDLSSGLDGFEGFGDMGFGDFLSSTDPSNLDFSSFGLTNFTWDDMKSTLLSSGNLTNFTATDALDGGSSSFGSLISDANGAAGGSIFSSLAGTSILGGLLGLGAASFISSAGYPQPRGATQANNSFTLSPPAQQTGDLHTAYFMAEQSSLVDLNVLDAAKPPPSNTPKDIQTTPTKPSDNWYWSTPSILDTVTPESNFSYDPFKDPSYIAKLQQYKRPPELAQSNRATALRKMETMSTAELQLFLDWMEYTYYQKGRYPSGELFGYETYGKDLLKKKLANQPKASLQNSLNRDTFNASADVDPVGQGFKEDLKLGTTFKSGQAQIKKDAQNISDEQIYIYSEKNGKGIWLRGPNGSGSGTELPPEALQKVLATKPDRVVVVHTHTGDVGPNTVPSVPDVIHQSINGKQSENIVIDSGGHTWKYEAMPQFEQYQKEYLKREAEFKAALVRQFSVAPGTRAQLEKIAAAAVNPRDSQGVQTIRALQAILDASVAGQFGEDVKRAAKALQNDPLKKIDIEYSKKYPNLSQSDMQKVVDQYKQYGVVVIPVK